MHYFLPATHRKMVTLPSDPLILSLLLLLLSEAMSSFVVVFLKYERCPKVTFNGKVDWWKSCGTFSSTLLTKVFSRPVWEARYNYSLCRHPVIGYLSCVSEQIWFELRKVGIY